MRPNDLFHISATNLDHLTETYNIGFYLEYLTKWPDLCRVIEGMDGKIEGYSGFTLSFTFILLTTYTTYPHVYIRREEGMLMPKRIQS